MLQPSRSGTARWSLGIRRVLKLHRKYTNVTRAAAADAAEQGLPEGYGRSRSCVWPRDAHDSRFRRQLDDACLVVLGCARALGKLLPLPYSYPVRRVHSCSTPCPTNPETDVTALNNISPPHLTQLSTVVAVL